MRLFSLRVFIAILAALAAACPWAAAAELAVSSRSVLTVAGGRIMVEVYAENSGTGPVYQVRAYLHIFGRRHENPAAFDLAAKQSRVFRFSVPLPQGRTGTFPFAGEIVFHDPQQLPFTVFSAGTFRYGAAGDVRIAGTAADVQMASAGRMRIAISSREESPLDIEAALYLPDALTTPQSRKRLQLSPFETATVVFPLACRPGSAGAATYPVFCILSTSAGGKQQAAIVRSTVHVKAEENWFVRTRWRWLAGAGWLPLAWALLWLRGRGERAPLEVPAG